jgi:hypothetical protein
LITKVKRVRWHEGREEERKVEGWLALGRRVAVPEFIDIYGLTKHRDTETIKRFLDEYVNESAHEDMGDEELMMLPLGRKKWGIKYVSPKAHEQAMRHDEAYSEQFHEPEWQAAVSLRHVVQMGLDYPRRAFTVYLRPREQGIDDVTLSFTVDDMLILGVSVDAESEERRGRELLEKIMQHYDCFLGMIAAEEAPPVSEEEFRSAGVRPHNMYFVEASGALE